METMTLESSKNTETNKSERRDSSRTTAPSIEIKCEGDMYVIKDWSFGGCQFENYSGKLRSGDTVLLDLFLLGFHDREGLPITAEVIRFEQDNNQSLALKFLDLNAQTILNYCDSVEKSLGDRVRKANT